MTHARRVNATDTELIQDALAGRQAAYASLVERYQSFAFTLSYRMVKNREEAHEVAQDAFIKAFKHLASFEGKAKFSTWLYKIVYTSALNHLRKNRPDWVSIDDDARPIQLNDPGVEPVSVQLEKNERAQEIRKAIQHLSPEDASVITLFYLYEKKLEEICEIMDLSLSNAKTKLSRARKRLKTIIEDSYSDLQTP
jgi:RNA polymerase sigma-70 factor (ECF subfamily)